MDKKLNVKLIDFGFAMKINPTDKSKTYCGTPTYMSPQLIARRSYDPVKADVWAIGVVFYILFHGQFPFLAQTDDMLK